MCADPTSPVMASFAAEEYPDRDIGKLLWTQAEGVDVDSDEHRHMVEQEKFYGGEGGILGAMEKHSLHLLMVPSSMDIANDLAAKMGFPVLGVPIGFPVLRVPLGFPVLGVPLGFYPEGTPVELDDCEPHLVWVAPGIPYSLTLISKPFSDGFHVHGQIKSGEILCPRRGRGRSDASITNRFPPASSAALLGASWRRISCCASSWQGMLAAGRQAAESWTWESGHQARQSPTTYQSFSISILDSSPLLVPFFGHDPALSTR